MGPGKIMLLRYVAEHGSLWKAAQEMGMSYRWAWGRIKKAEEVLGIPLLTKDEKGKGKAKVLSPEAREIIEWYSRTEAELTRVLAEAEARQPEVLRRAGALSGADLTKKDL